MRLQEVGRKAPLCRSKNSVAKVGVLFSEKRAPTCLSWLQFSLLFCSFALLWELKQKVAKHLPGCL